MLIYLLHCSPSSAPEIVSVSHNDDDEVMVTVNTDLGRTWRYKVKGIRLPPLRGNSKSDSQCIEFFFKVTHTSLSPSITGTDLKALRQSQAGPSPQCTVMSGSQGSFFSRLLAHRGSGPNLIYLCFPVAFLNTRM